jgi:hypothetical protein
MDKPRLRELYYAKNGKIIILSEEEKENKLTQISDVDELEKNILRGIEWQSSESKLQKIKISTGIIAEAKTSKGTDILMQNGCDELSAKVIADGLSGKVNYYAVIITVFEGEKDGVYNIMLVDSPSGMYLIQPDGGDVLFEPLSSQQAEQKISDLIRSSFEGAV